MKAVALWLCLSASLVPAVAQTWPGIQWEACVPEAAGLATAKLEAIRDIVGGRGCVVRHGKMAFAWGDQSKSYDVASAVKPVISTLLFLAIRERKLGSPDALVADFEPRLNALNNGKDKTMTWRHLASQTSGYGLAEKPGAAYSYNDFALALYYDTLTEKVLQQPGLDAFRQRLAGPMQFQDSISFDKPRPGRLALSVRDFARFGLLALHKGRWRYEQLVPASAFETMFNSPIPASTPLTSKQDAEMLPGQRSLGGTKSITPNGPGVYSFNWWLNRKDSQGRLALPTAPLDTILASGHGAKRTLWVIPSLDLVVSWNDSLVDDHDKSPGNPDTKLNSAARLLVEAVLDARK
ncbi:MAG: serine hydrolase domain-containing protein [Limisphaerales bacterium]